MPITKKSVAEKIGAYLHHELTREQLVDWAETAMMDADFDEREMDAVRHVVSRLGVADVRAFGLTWEECREFLRRLGFDVRVEIVSA